MIGILSCGQEKDATIVSWLLEFLSGCVAGEGVTSGLSFSNAGLGTPSYFFAGDSPLEWVRPIPKASERSWHASGSSFNPNG